MPCVVYDCYQRIAGNSTERAHLIEAEAHEAMAESL
jgi:hypothetical protein